MKIWVFLIFLFALQNSYAVNNVVLKEVMGNSTKTVELDPSKSPVLFLFGENCSYCKAQVKELNCLKENEINYLAIMLMKNEQNAFKEKQKIKLKDKLYLSNVKFEESFQIKKKITPTIIIPKGNKFSVVYGKKTCSEIIEYGKN